MSKHQTIQGRPALRVQVAAGRYRVIDLAVCSGEPPAELVPTVAPLIAIEILSPDDRMAEMLEKLWEYTRWGVPHVWLVDPGFRPLTDCR